MVLTNKIAGGPLVVLGEDSTKDIQIGVVSWSMPAGCATKVFPVVRVDIRWYNVFSNKSVLLHYSADVRFTQEYLVV